MEDSESMLAQTTTSSGYSSVDHNNAKNAALLTGVSVAHGSNLDLGNTNPTDVNTSMDSTQVTGSGNIVSKARDIATAMTENGIDSEANVASAAQHQPMDCSERSEEEDRLWSIVTTNSMDFNAWTSLVDVIERMSEGNINKIQKVYDTFLAEFPLCYGYWKKYADHVARLSSVDKVAVVYERAVQGVTYSVDMWLHYCVFFISSCGS